LATSVIISEPPDNLVDTLVPAAVADVFNPPLTEDEAANYSNKIFMDGNGVLAI
jgi:hypothetical protein